MSEKSDGMIGISDHSLTFELVNDKAELEFALAVLKPQPPYQRYNHLMYDDVSGLLEDTEIALDVVAELVPRLMQSYEQLLETSYALADAWESYMNDQTPAGLYVPN